MKRSLKDSKSDLDLEIRRQLVHVCGISTIALLVLLEKRVVVQILGIFILCMLVAAFCRLNKSTLKRTFIKHFLTPFERFERFILKYERSKEFPFGGALTFYLGIFVTVALFEFSYSVAGIVVLSLADALSTLVGKFWGKHKLGINPKKSWEGSLTFLVSSFVILMFFTALPNAFVIAILLTFIEMAPKINDNFTLPLFTAAFLKVFG